MSEHQIGSYENCTPEELRREKKKEALHQKFLKMAGQIEDIIDQLKSLGPDPWQEPGQSSNALLNTREWLEQLSRR